MARQEPFPLPRELDEPPTTWQRFAPKPQDQVNLEELARQLEKPPLKGVAEAIANLKFHELMEMANAIGTRGTAPSEDPNYTWVKQHYQSTDPRVPLYDVNREKLQYRS